MASRIEGVDEKILFCAKEEFLKNGYVNASLRTIAQNAGVSTSTIYTRYKDKEGLFRFLVEPVTKRLQVFLQESLENFLTLDTSELKEEINKYSDNGFEKVLSYIYEYFSEFRILITGSPNVFFQEFLESLVEIDMQCTKNFLRKIGSKSMLEGRITDGFLHVVSSAFYSGVFEVVIHNMPIEEAREYTKELRVFYGNGWKEYYEV